MKIYAINYQKHYGNDWTVYKQTIKIDKELMEKYNSELEKEYWRINSLKVYSYHDMKLLSYTKKLENWINYLHLTWLEKLFEIVRRELGKNDRMLYRNTIVEVL